MAALNTDLVRTTAPNFATTLANAMLVSDTSMTLQSATGLSTATAITLVIDATDTVSGAATPNLKEVVTGTLSGSVVSNLLRGQDGTTQQAHTSGANVVMWWNANMINDFETSYLTQHKQLGTHTGITTDTITTSGNASVGGTLAVTGATTLTGAVGGAGFSASTFSNPYKFYVYRNAAQSVANNAPVQFDTKIFDTGSNVDIVTNKGRFTAPIAGFYQFQYSVSWSINGQANTGFGVSAIKNGSSSTPLGGSNTQAQMYNGSYVYTNIGFALAQLAANDYVEIWNNQSPNNNALSTGAVATYFQGFLVSQT